jgi:hypothetical protein
VGTLITMITHMGPTPAGWYYYGRETTKRWWDGTQWTEPPAEAKRAGPEVFQLQLRPPGAGLFVYESEVWKLVPTGLGTSVGGLLAGARAEVVVQNQLQVGSRVRGARTLGATLLHVTSPAFEFTFSLESRREQTMNNLSLLNKAAEFINAKGRELASNTPALTVSKSAAPLVSVADELAKFADLRDRGIVSEDEFQAKKSALLS